MLLYRIVRDRRRAQDLSGMGASRTGGRWNSKGVPMLYTSENSSLALLEILVHTDPLLLPSRLFVATLELDDSVPLYPLPDEKYPADWTIPGLLANQALGDQWMRQQRFLAFRVRSAVNPLEYNFILNPRFPGFADALRVAGVRELRPDKRLKG